MKSPVFSNEVKGRLASHRPGDPGQASRMIGMTLAGVANLMIYLKNSWFRTPNVRR